MHVNRKKFMRAIEQVKAARRPIEKSVDSKRFLPSELNLMEGETNWLYDVSTTIITPLKDIRVKRSRMFELTACGRLFVATEIEENGFGFRQPFYRSNSLHIWLPCSAIYDNPRSIDGMWIGKHYFDPWGREWRPHKKEVTHLPSQCTKISDHLSTLI